MRARISAVSVIWLGVVTVQMELLGPARAPVSQPGIQWRHLSSANGDLPVPGESKEQTAASSPTRTETASRTSSSASGKKHRRWSGIGESPQGGAGT